MNILVRNRRDDKGKMFVVQFRDQEEKDFVLTGLAYEKDWINKDTFEHGVLTEIMEKIDRRCNDTYASRDVFQSVVLFENETARLLNCLLRLNGLHASMYVEKDYCRHPRQP